jgi:hypothetical protein
MLAILTSSLLLSSSLIDVCVCVCVCGTVLWSRECLRAIIKEESRDMVRLSSSLPTLVSGAGITMIIREGALIRGENCSCNGRTGVTGCNACDIYKVPTYST